MSQKGNPQANFRVFNLDSEDEIDFESSISNNEEADSKQFILDPYSEAKDEEMKCFQGPTELVVDGIEKKQLSDKIGHQKYKNKNFPTLFLKKLIAFFKCLPQIQWEQYRGLMELLQEKARMKREKKQVSFAKRHHIRLNKCPASAQLYCCFLENYLMPAFKQSRKIKDASIYVPCIAKYLALSNKVQQE